MRLISAAELAKNPGYDVSEVARVLEFASPSHLTSTAQRIVGTRFRFAGEAEDRGFDREVQAGAGQIAD